MAVIHTLAANPGSSDADDDIEEMLADGRLDAAREAASRRLVRDPADGEGWLLQARILEADGRHAEAAEACARAIALWPDVTPAFRLQLRLARQAGDSAAAVPALRALLASRPEDPHLNGEIGALLAQAGDYQAALPHLRIAAPVLLHEYGTIWNYTVGLALTGGFHELLETQPLLDRMADGQTAPYTPYRHLATAKLALQFDRTAVIAAQQRLEASSAWQQSEQVMQRIAAAVEAQAPFSLVCLDQDIGYFACLTSLHAHLVLRPQEVLALGSAMSEKWFGCPFETLPAGGVAALGERVRSAVAEADLVGVPDAGTLLLDNMHFGLLAEMRQVYALQARPFLTSFRVAQALHEIMPFLRPVLQGLPFLGVVGRHPELAPRLARFCGIAETQTIRMPEDAAAGVDGAPDRLGRIEQALDRLVVPFRGAVFLVAVPGPCGVAVCGRLRQLGGIALDLAAVVPSWTR